MIGFVIVPALSAAPGMPCHEVPLTAEYSHSGRKAAAFREAGIALSDDALVSLRDRNTGERFTGWLVPDAAAKAAARLLDASDPLLALQVRRALAERA